MVPHRRPCPTPQPALAADSVTAYEQCSHWTPPARGFRCPYQSIAQRSPLPAPEQQCAQAQSPCMSLVGGKRARGIHGVFKGPQGPPHINPLTKTKMVRAGAQKQQRCIRQGARLQASAKCGRSQPKTSMQIRFARVGVPCGSPVFPAVCLCTMLTAQWPLKTNITTLSIFKIEPRILNILRINTQRSR